MTLTVTHTFVNAVADDPAAASAGEVLPSHWNASHTLSGSGTLTKTDDTNVTLTLGGTPSGSLVNDVSLTAGWTGTLAAGRLNSNVVQGVTNDTNIHGTISAQNLTFSWAGTLGLAKGGTNVDLSATGGTANYLKQISAGANITVGTIPASDIASGAALTKVDDTNVTLTLGGAPTTSLLSASSITAGWTGTLAAGRLNANVVQGVTNDTNITGTISAQNLTFAWSGALGVTRGGTGTGTAFTTGSIVFADGSGVYNQNNTKFFWDNSNNFLGIGTAVPSVPAHITKTDAATTALAEVQRWEHLSSGSIGAGSGGFGILNTHHLQNSAGASVEAFRTAYFWNDATAGAEYGQWEMDMRINGVSKTIMNVNFDGSFHFSPFYANITSRSPDPGGEMSSVYENNGAASTINLQDASAFPGRYIEFCVTNAGGVQINAATGKIIYIGGNTAGAVPGKTTASGHINSTAIGSAIRLVADNSGNYFAIGYTGTWTAA